MRKTALAGLLLAAGLALTACDDADVANRNISKEANNFNVARQVVFVNGITDEYLLSVEGYCQIERSGDSKTPQVTVTCKHEDGYKRHHLGLSDNVTYFVEQVDASNVSADHYKVTYKPTVIIPHLENTSGD
ncbi:hypothetical protein [Nesterenkonia rhizosphaerae]|uniref:Lipoprotein n=1 Tax=Nesterenkonia rhizosphaerae TaxID=1348272 RepID=A0ABP9FSY7_9MICC